jgi:hypothetical protein
MKTHPTMSYVLIFFLFAIFFQIFKKSCPPETGCPPSWWDIYVQNRLLGGAAKGQVPTQPQDDDEDAFLYTFTTLKGFSKFVSLAVVTKLFMKLRDVLHQKNLQNELLKVLNNINHPKTPKPGANVPIKDLQDIEEMMRHRRRRPPSSSRKTQRKTTTRRRSPRVSTATTRTRRHR